MFNQCSDQGFMGKVKVIIMNPSEVNISALWRAKPQPDSLGWQSAKFEPQGVSVS